MSEGPPHCAFFLPSKKRHCRLAPVLGKPYCSSHYVVLDGHRKRVCPYNRHQCATPPAPTSPSPPCPLLNPTFPLRVNHTLIVTSIVLEHHYDRHVRKCPDAHVQALAWEEHDVNTGSDDEGPVRTPTPAEERQIALIAGEKAAVEGNGDVPAPPVVTRRAANPTSQLPDEQTRSALLERVRAALGTQWPEIAINEASPEGHSPSGERQAVQLAALVQLITSFAPDTQRSVFCELGCGKASLSAALRVYLGPSSAHILLDRSRFRHTCDRAVRQSGEGEWVRVCCDVRHVRLSALPLVSNSSLVVITKHLCGNATDLALRACRPVPRPSALVLALCCHHRCDWASYPNKPFLRGIGVDESDFTYLSRMSSWAVCAHGDTERVRAGRACKRLLDEGRRLFLEELGYEARLVAYVGPETTPENIALTAVLKHAL